MEFIFHFAFILTTVTHADPLVLILGDSLTAGYGLKESQAYPALVETALKSEAGLTNLKVLNGGVSGDTTAGGLRRLPWMLKTSHANVLIIALGGNDMLRGLPTDVTYGNIKKMIALARGANVDVIVFGIQAPANLGEKYSKEFDGIFERLKKEERIPIFTNYIRKVAGRFDLNLPDGIHPNVEGHKILAQEISAFLKPLLVKGISE